MRVAALDLGSNTSLLLIAEVVSGVSGGKVTKVISDNTTVTKMGQGVHQAKRFHPDALTRVKECLQEYRHIIDRSSVDKVLAVATSAARDVENQNELVKICADLKIPLEIISGDREARMTFLGAVSDVSDPAGEGIAVIDVGGGSTELIVQQNGEIHGVSVNVGSVRLADLFVKANPIPDADLQAAKDYAKEKFGEGKARLKGIRPKRVIGVAGTPTTLAALEWNEPFSETKVHGFKLSVDTIDKWIKTLAPLSIQEREKFKGLEPKRADVIVLGSIALREAMRALESQEMTVSVRGVRYGLAMEMAK
jgi:exopolyphosphatase/guanosine-5'-triphosphate,3'-diphosphate pyrophosphatase